MNQTAHTFDPWWMWCLFLVVGFGACIGSFINVIVYRMPRNIPLNRPRWSFCPHCGHQIRWMHNVPVLSYFLLRGRCADCGKRISPQYVIIEASTILVFLMLFDALFVGGCVGGVIGGKWSVAYRFYSDWTIFAALAMLFACLLAMSVIDLELYWVDIRFTRLATVCGFLMHALWAPGAGWPQPSPRFGLSCLAASAMGLATHLAVVWYWRKQVPSLEPGPGDTPAPSEAPASASTSAAPAGTEAPAAAALLGAAAGIVLAFSLVLLCVTLVGSSGGVPPGSFSAYFWRIGPGLLFILLALVGGSTVHRESDQQIVACLESERSGARRVALIETLILLPTVLTFVGAWLLSDQFVWLCNWRPVGSFRPVAGLCTAGSGFFVAIALGWAVRVGFTMLLGKEAFGSGDIHLMGAAGAVVGWEVVVVGFFLASVLALVGKVLTLPFKGGRVLPMGPWLSLGILIITLLRQEVLMHIITPAREAYTAIFRALF